MSKSKIPMPQRSTLAKSRKVVADSFQRVNNLIKTIQTTTPVQPPKPKKKKRLNRRRNRRRMQNGLTTMTNDFMKCRLDPLMHGGNATGIPDKSSIRRIMFDHKVVQTFTPDIEGSTLNIAITPCIPCGIWSSCTGNYDINIAHLQIHAVNNTNRYTAVPFTEWWGQTVVRHNQAGRYDECAPYIGAVKCRIATVGWKLMFTGSSMNNSGVIRINNCPLDTSAAIPNTSDFTVFGSTNGSQEIFSPNQVLVRVLNQELTNANNTQETRIYPVSQGAKGILRRVSDDYEWTSLSPNLTFLAYPNDDNLGAVTAMYLYGPDKASWWPHIAAVDENFSSTVLSITGLQAKQSVTLEAIYCIEYAPANNSSIYALAKAPAKSQLNIIEKAETAARSLPVASTLSAIAGDVMSAVKVVNTAAQFVGM